MSKWKRVKLGDYICQVRGVSYSPKDASEVPENSHRPILRAHNIQDDGINFDNLVFVNSGRIKEVQYIRKGDIIICASSGSKNLVGKAVQANKDMPISFGAFCKVVRTKKIYPPYLGTFFKSKKYRQTISTLSAGANINNIKNEDIEGLEIPLPPLEAQRKIAKTLDTVSEILAMRKQQLAELDNLIKSIFYDMFGDPVGNEKGWEVSSLKNVCRRITDGTHHSPPNPPEGEYKYITAKNIKKDGLDLDNVTFVTEKDHKSIFRRCDPEYGDVLYIKDGVTTGIAQVNTLYEEFSLLSSVALLKLNAEILKPFFLREVLNNKNMYRAIRINMGGAAITRLTLKKIGLITIPVPPLFIQAHFETIVLKVEDQKKLIQTAIDETQYLFDSLMSQYFD